MNILSASIVLTGLMAATAVQASCGSSACSINTNWDEHSVGIPGWTAELRYSYSKADQLRQGSHKIAADTTADGEVENLGTVNKIVTSVLDYTHDDHWGITLQLPYVTREHEHNLGPYTGADAAGYEKFHASALGDVKLIGRYRWAYDEVSSIGVKFGLKLNTGRKDFLLVDNSGATKLPSEVTLQPGNGSTDLIVGAFWQQATPGGNWNWFAQTTLQKAIHSDASFRPGRQFNIDGGTRYAISHNLSGLLQVNAQWIAQDSGDAAAPSAFSTVPGSATGGKTFSLTPGLSYAFTPKLQLYGLVQLPLYQYVNGEQLTAKTSLTLGVSHRL